MNANNPIDLQEPKETAIRTGESFLEESRQTPDRIAPRTASLESIYYTISNLQEAVTAISEEQQMKEEDVNLLLIEHGINKDTLDADLGMNGGQFEVQDFQRQNRPPYAALLEHDFRNSMQLVIGYAGLLTSGDLDVESMDLIKDILLPGSEKTLLLADIIAEGYANNGKITDVNAHHILDTIFINNEELNAYMRENIKAFPIETLEEFITIRTLLDNASNAAPKELAFPRVDLEVDDREEEKIYTITDNFPDHRNKTGEVKWSEEAKEDLIGIRIKGSREPRIRADDPHGGLRLTAYRAGQRGNYFAIGENLGANTKHVSVGFPVE